MWKNDDSIIITYWMCDAVFDWTQLVDMKDNSLSLSLSLSPRSVGKEMAPSSFPSRPRLVLRQTNDSYR